MKTSKALHEKKQHILWLKALQDKIDIESTTAIESFCNDLLLLGYNSVILETGTNEWEPSFKNALSLLKRRGFRIFIAIDEKAFSLPAPFHSSYRKKIEESLSVILEQRAAFDGIFWVARCFSFRKGDSKERRSLLQREVAQIEAKILEELLGADKQLLYYLPAFDFAAAEKQSRWMMRLARGLSKQTAIVFYSASGDLGADHQPSHPFWRLLSGEDGRSAGKFLPIINVGGIGQGEGFWPAIAIDQMERYACRCQAAPFDGAIALTAHVPQKNAFLFCSLWGAAQMLSGGRSTGALIEEWLKAYRPKDLACPQVEWMLREVRDIAVRATPFIRAPLEIPKEVGKPQVEALLMRLNCLNTLVEEIPPVEGDVPYFRDYFIFFLRDMRKVMMHYLQVHQLPQVHILTPEDLQDSFWASASGTKIWFHEHATYNSSNRKMAQIYEQVTGEKTK